MAEVNEIRQIERVKHAACRQFRSFTRGAAAPTAESDDRARNDAVAAEHGRKGLKNRDV